MDMKTIYILSWDGESDVGGVERVVYLLHQLLRSSYQVIIVDKAYALQLLQMEKDEFNFIHPIKKMIILSKCARKLRKGLRGIIIGHGFNAPFVKKDINFAHGNMYGVKKALHQFPYGGSTIFEMLSHWNSNKVIAVSQASKNSLIKNYYITCKKIGVICNCVDTNIFYPQKLTEAKECTILFAGRLETGKGIVDLEALAKAIETKKEIRLKIATNSIENIEIFSKYKNTEVLVSLPLADMNDFYNSGSVFYFPSKFEGFEMVTLESLSAGIPVVGNAVGAIEELAQRNFPGVEVLKDQNVQKTLQTLLNKASKYAEFEQRNELHKLIKLQHGYEQYKNKILSAIENYEEKRE